ncbi:hypothetical protein [Streptomyces sp. Tu 3180]|uniref:hypothetical protein n=1 Tax=Streptomyces sp. Tu 3180 TaxID=2682611 RepID=UPI001357FF55|nr:hypothetical protein [Streptomyces sp. Tu 3180]KAF3463318.1 hypothetical protein GL259_02385 [Streptomyces sp. Tu 3180]
MFTDQLCGEPAAVSADLNLLIGLRCLLVEDGRLLVTGLQHQPASMLRLIETDTLLTLDATRAARPRATHLVQGCTGAGLLSPGVTPGVSPSQRPVGPR